MPAMVLPALLFLSFIAVTDEQKLLDWGNRCFCESYDASGDTSLKKYDLVLTHNAFIRLLKTYQNGKQEYYSFQVHRLNEIKYIRNPDGDTLQFKTNADDVILQTFNDPDGDLDSMVTHLDIPVNTMPKKRLDSLQKVLDYFKNKSL